MAQYEYIDDQGHVQSHLRTFAHKHDPTTCKACGGAMWAIEISKTHVEPDGMYSYMPNLGDAGQFERRLIAQKEGKKIYRKEA